MNQKNSLPILAELCFLLLSSLRCPYVGFLIVDTDAVKPGRWVGWASHCSCVVVQTMDLVKQGIAGI